MKVFSKKEEIFIQKVLRFLETNKLHPNSFKFKIAVGRFKGACHNIHGKSVEKYISGLIRKKYPSVRWDYVRDYDRMYRYRKKHRICEICRKERSSQTHHKTSTINGGLEKESNYQALCWRCHWGEHPYLDKKNFMRFR